MTPTRSGQVVTQPSLVGMMLQALHLTGKEKVMEIGTGTGYQSAVLSLLVKGVYTIELLPILARQAKKVLEELGCHNVYVITGNGLPGLPDFAPFDAIVVDAAIEHIPQTWVDQLKEGGRIVVPVGRDIWNEHLMAGVKHHGKVILRKIKSVQVLPIMPTKKLKSVDGVTQNHSTLSFRENEGPNV